MERSREEIQYRSQELTETARELQGRASELAGTAGQQLERTTRTIRNDPNTKLASGVLAFLLTASVVLLILLPAYRECVGDQVDRYTNRVRPESPADRIRHWGRNLVDSLGLGD
ncbi:MAG: hypothetical protein ACYC1C_21165 [Chloroflexota bacterium]